MDVITHYLQMHGRPEGAALLAPRAGLSVVHAVAPTVGWYRFLYGTAGGPWQWVDRTRMADEALGAIVRHPDVAVHVLFVDGVPAGYIELDARAGGGEVEVAYFGIFPEFIGQKLGPYLLAWGIHRAWDDPATRRLWVHTCSLDHPSALATYQRLGFVKYDEHHHAVDEAAP
jgi:GNAT superfamily N-acetyltransferase